jgi:site-specific recombinase XerD
VAADPIAIAPDPELAELIDDFLASQLSPRTRESYGGDLAIFLRWVAERGKHPRDVARPDVDRYRNWLAEPIGPDGKPAANGRPRYAPATVARKLSAVRAFYNYLSERRVIPGSPAAGVKGPRLRREPRGRAITDEQVRRSVGCGPARSNRGSSLASTGFRKICRTRAAMRPTDTRPPIC